MVRGGCLPIRSEKRMAWKYDDDDLICGQHVLFECYRYGEEQGQLRGV